MRVDHSATAPWRRHIAADRPVVRPPVRWPAWKSCRPPESSATIWMGSARQSGWRVSVAAMIAANTVARKSFVER
jgi:hypothetical protein